MTATLTREDIKYNTRQLVKYLDRKYGYHHWDNDEVEHDPNVIAYRKQYDRPEVKARENGTGYMPVPKEEFLNMNKGEKEQYIVDQYQAGTRVDEICKNLGYASNTPMYRILKKHGVEVKRMNKTSMITQEMLIKASENAACTSEVAKALERYSPEINTVDVRHLFERFGMQKAYKAIKKRWRYRYFIKDGEVTRYNNMAQISRDLGVSTSTLNAEAKKEKPRFKILTWKEMQDDEDI